MVLTFRALSNHVTNVARKHQLEQQLSRSVRVWFLFFGTQLLDKINFRPLLYRTAA